MLRHGITSVWGLMKTAILANAALCLCPPLIAAAGVVAVPSARSAVHHMTAPHRHHSVKKKLTPQPCAPLKRATAAAGLSEDPTRLIADLMPADADAPLRDEIGALYGGPPLSATAQGPGNGLSAGGGTDTFPLGPGPVIGTPPNPPIGPVGPQPTAAVPEPASWTMMVAGFLGIGTLVRRRARNERRRRTLTRAGLAASVEFLSSTAAGPAQTAAFAAVRSLSAVKGMTAAAIAKKTAVCVCSGAVLATAVITMPPLKRAVYSATTSAPALLPECRPVP